MINQGRAIFFRACVYRHIYSTGWQTTLTTIKYSKQSAHTHRGRAFLLRQGITMGETAFSRQKKTKKVKTKKEVYLKFFFACGISAQKPLSYSPTTKCTQIKLSRIKVKLLDATTPPFYLNQLITDCALFIKISQVQSTIMHYYHIQNACSNFI